MTEQTNFSLFNKKDTRNFMRLLKYLTPYKIRIVWALLAIMVGARSGTPALSRDRVEAHTEPMEVEPLEPRASETWRIA